MSNYGSLSHDVTNNFDEAINKILKEVQTVLVGYDSDQVKKLLEDIQNFCSGIPDQRVRLEVAKTIAQIIETAQDQGFDGSEIAGIVASGAIPLLRALKPQPESVDQASKLILEIFRKSKQNFVGLVEVLIEATNGDLTVDHLKCINYFMELEEAEIGIIQRLFLEGSDNPLFDNIRGLIRLDTLEALQSGSELALKCGISATQFFEFLADVIGVLAKSQSFWDENKLNYAVNRVTELVEKAEKGGLYGIDFLTVLDGVVTTIEHFGDRDLDELFAVCDKVLELALADTNQGWGVDFQSGFSSVVNLINQGFPESSIDETLMVYGKMLEIAKAAKEAGLDYLEFSALFESGIGSITRVLGTRDINEIFKLYDKVEEIAKAAKEAGLSEREFSALLYLGIGVVTESFGTRDIDEIFKLYDKMLEIAKAANQAGLSEREFSALFWSGIGAITRVLGTRDIGEILRLYDKVEEIVKAAKQAGLDYLEFFALFESGIGVVMKSLGTRDIDEILRLYDKVEEIVKAAKEAGLSEREFSDLFKSGISVVTKSLGTRNINELFNLYDKMLEIAKAAKEAGISGLEFSALFESGIGVVMKSLDTRDIDKILRLYDKMLEIAKAAKQAGLDYLEFFALFESGIGVVMKSLGTRDIDEILRLYDKVEEIVKAAKQAGLDYLEFSALFESGIGVITDSLGTRDIDEIFKLYDKMLEIAKAANQAGLSERELYALFESGIGVVMKSLGTRDIDEILKLYDKVEEIVKAAKEAGLSEREFSALFKSGISVVTESLGTRNINELFNLYDKMLEIAKAAKEAGISGLEFSALFESGIGVVTESLGTRDINEIFKLYDKMLEIAKAAKQAGLEELEVTILFNSGLIPVISSLADVHIDDLLIACDKVLQMFVDAKRSGMNLNEVRELVQSIDKLTNMTIHQTSRGELSYTEKLDSLWKVASALIENGVRGRKLIKLLSIFPEFIFHALKEGVEGSTKVEQMFIDAALIPLPSGYRLSGEEIGELEAMLLFIRTGAVYGQYSSFESFKTLLAQYGNYSARPVFECNEEFEFLIHVEGGKVALKQGAVIDSGILKMLNEAVNSDNRENIDSRYKEFLNRVKENLKARGITVLQGQLSEEILQEMLKELEKIGGDKDSVKASGGEHQKSLTHKEKVAIRFLVRQAHPNLENIPVLPRNLYNARGPKDVAEIHRFVRELTVVLSHTREQLEQVQVDSEEVSEFINEIRGKLTLLINKAESVIELFMHKGEKTPVKCRLEARKDGIDAVGYGDLGDCCIVSSYGNEIERDDFQPIRIVDWEGRIVGYVYAVKAEVGCEKKVVDGEEVVVRSRPVLVLAGIEPNWGIKGILDPESFVTGLVEALIRVCQQNGIEALYSNAGGQNGEDDGRISQLSEIREAINSGRRIEELNEPIQFPAKYREPIKYVYKLWERR